MIAGLVQGVLLLGLASAIGGLAIELLLPAASAPDTDDARARLRRWITTCLLLVALATWVELLVRAQAASGASLGAAVAAVPSFVAGTHVGQVLVARGAAIVVALLLWSELARGFRVFVLLLTVGMTLSLSLTGHAADRSGLTLGIVNDWAHALAACAWIGGLIALAFVIGPRGAAWSSETLDAVLPRFSRLAWLCLLVVVVTGSYSAWIQVGGFSRLATTTYGQVLLVKLLIVAGLVGIRASRGAPSASPETRLTAYAGVEALLGLAVFASAAVLGELTPARYTTLQQRPTAPVATPASPGAAGPRDGTATPPHGDAVRGRTVFIRLECGGCHAVPDRSVSPPTRPGPDLAEVAARRPNDLAEAIMNPSAHEGGRPTAEELSDLVEYLRSLERAAPPAGAAPPSDSPPAGSAPPASTTPPTTTTPPPSAAPPASPTPPPSTTPPAAEPPAGERSAEPPR